eukprot:58026-Chlamydomonas_euryale.AAC.8
MLPSDSAWRSRMMRSGSTRRSRGVARLWDTGQAHQTLVERAGGSDVQIWWGCVHIKVSAQGCMGEYIATGRLWSCLPESFWLGLTVIQHIYKRGAGCVPTLELPSRELLGLAVIQHIYKRGAGCVLHQTLPRRLGHACMSA